jgi:hypothetical protein
MISVKEVKREEDTQGNRWVSVEIDFGDSRGRSVHCYKEGSTKDDLLPQGGNGQLCDWYRDSSTPSCHPIRVNMTDVERRELVSQLLTILQAE